jgi:hypothetical protein
MATRGACPCPAQARGRARAVITGARRNHNAAPRGPRRAAHVAPRRRSAGRTAILHRRWPSPAHLLRPVDGLLDRAVVERHELCEGVALLEPLALQVGGRGRGHLGRLHAHGHRALGGGPRAAGGEAPRAAGALLADRPHAECGRVAGGRMGGVVPRWASCCALRGWWCCCWPVRNLREACGPGGAGGLAFWTAGRPLGQAGSRHKAPPAPARLGACPCPCRASVCPTAASTIWPADVLHAQPAAGCARRRPGRAGGAARRSLHRPAQHAAPLPPCHQPPPPPVLGPALPARLAARRHAARRRQGRLPLATHQLGRRRLSGCRSVAALCAQACRQGPSGCSRQAGQAG